MDQIRTQMTHKEQEMILRQEKQSKIAMKFRKMIKMEIQTLIQATIIKILMRKDRVKKIKILMMKTIRILNQLLSR